MKPLLDFNLESTAIRSLQVVEDPPHVSLPLLATASDVRETVQFLKRKPEGITSAQAMDSFRKRVFDPRKVAAYEFLGIVTRDGDRLKLSALGWELAKRQAPEAEVYRTILRRTLPYHSALEWIFDRNLEVITHLEIGAFWQNQQAESVEGDFEEKIEGYAATFFHLCHAAEIGMLTIGRKGQPTRLNIYCEELNDYIDNNPVIRLEERTGSYNQKLSSNGKAALARQESTTRSCLVPRVFISHRGDTNIMARIEEALDLADLEYEIVQRNSLESVPMSDEIFQAMRRCDAGIILVTENDYHNDDTGQPVVDENLLVEIGAAFIQFERRVVLLRQTRIPLPVKLQGLDSCEFEAQGLGWDVAVKLIKSVKQFREKPDN